MRTNTDLRQSRLTLAFLTQRTRRSTREEVQGVVQAASNEATWSWSVFERNLRTFRPVIGSGKADESRIRMGRPQSGGQPQETWSGIRRGASLTVFADPLARIFDDPDHSADEPREIIIGYSLKPRLTVVGFTGRSGRVRLIHARRATKAERKRHEENITQAR
jgi:uncharacterized DUF497 family protein